MIRIITDSTCDINPDLISENEFDILPLKIIINDHQYTDTIDIKINEIYQAMRNGIIPKTAQITYESVYSTFKKHCENGLDIIYIAFSKEMSGCYTFASLIAQNLKETYPERKIEVIDSKCGSGALGLMVLQALKMVKAGLDFEVIVEQIHFMADHVELIFTLTNLNWIAKGGRLSRTAGYAGTLLNIKPILEVEDGKIITNRAVRGRNHSISEVVSEIVKRSKAFPNQLISITHADDEQMAYDLEKQIKTLIPECTTTITCIGSVLGVHLGIGGVGVYCFNKKPEHYIFD